MVQIYLGSLPGNTTETDIRKYFSKFGDIKKLKLKVNNKNSRNSTCLGFGFLTIKCEDPDSLISKSHFILGREIKCEPFLSGNQLKKMKANLSERRIFIWGIPNRMTNEEIEKLFSKIGPIESAYRVKVQSLSQPTNFGYVTFQESEDAAKALEISYIVTSKGTKIHMEKFKDEKQQKKKPQKPNNRKKGNSVQDRGRNQSSRLPTNPNPRRNERRRNSTIARNERDLIKMWYPSSNTKLRSQVVYEPRLLELVEFNHFYLNIQFKKCGFEG